MPSPPQRRVERTLRGSVREAAPEYAAVTLHRRSPDGKGLAPARAPKPAYYLEYVTRQANAYGLLPFCWDNGVPENLGSGIFDRSTTRSSTLGP